MKNYAIVLFTLLSSVTHAGELDVYPSLKNPEENKCVQVNRLENGNVAFKVCTISAKGLCSEKCGTLGNAAGYTSYQVQRAIDMSDEYSLLSDMGKSTGEYASTGAKGGAAIGLTVGAVVAAESFGTSLIGGPAIGWIVGGIGGTVAGFVKGAVYHGLKVSPMDEEVVADQTTFLSRFQTMDEFILELATELNRLK